MTAPEKIPPPPPRPHPDSDPAHKEPGCGVSLFVLSLVALGFLLKVAAIVAVVAGVAYLFGWRP